MTRRRLTSISLTDFRSIRGTVYTSLDAPVVLIHGPNGAGKTSVLSGIELALTGSIPSLARVEPEYLKHLVHKQARRAAVKLETTGFDVSPAALEVDEKGIRGRPTLDGQLAGLFSERCYLAQSALGRLLEIYQHKDARKSDSPLTQFVKDLLGLDRLDGLIDGLHTAGHISRLRGPVPEFHELRADIESLEKDINGLTSQAGQMKTYLQETGDNLSKRAGEILRSSVELSNLPGIIAELQKSPEEGRLSALARIRRDIDAAIADWQSVANDPITEDRERSENEAHAAQSELNEWRAGPGVALANLIAEVATIFPDLQLPASTNPDLARTTALRTAEKELARCTSVLSEDQRSTTRILAITQELERGAARVRLLDQQIQGISADTAQLAQSLAELLPHIHSDDCPVCGRDFSEVSRSPLSDRVSARIASLTESAGRLEALSKEKANAAGASAPLERERAQLTARLISDDTRNELKNRQARLGELVAQLTSIEPEATRGMTLLAQVNATAARLDQLRSRNQRVTNLQQTVTAIAKDLGITVDTAVVIGNALATMSDWRSQEEARLIASQSARKTALEQALEFQRSRDHLASFNLDIDGKRTRLAKLIQARESAEEVIHFARGLAQKASVVRTNIVRRVFNESLNSIWRDLFVRLAPEETFVPAFALPPGPGPVEAALETVHRSGEKGGNPRAMLSAGNLNTAALTLFLSLHLTAKLQLPWLIIDDPVQSMDELHIGQFAVLLRTLSKAHGRQIILAVHERALFDYLALELSPAFPNDRLVTLELGRSADGTTTHKWQTHIYEPDNAIAA
ncbi:AAA family ATPase [Bradyrhizobium sp. 170]|uniref:AAA family ATPase n=1 Tax=Bradyrhizobium sp. 170 TaxID=2782641 RepID=UPI0020003B0A|nr:AAA family ATPase [Bradyrhizobium sp. 170]UPK05923.1 AAA family ATPase [Bradyrhizobium sp. 170]